MSSTNNEFLEKRNVEIREVLQSMNDVNSIFHDVATLISNQVCPTMSDIFVQEGIWII